MVKETMNEADKNEFRFSIRDRVFHPMHGVGVVVGQKVIAELPCATCIFPKLGTGTVTLLESRLYPSEEINEQETEIEFIPEFECDDESIDVGTRHGREGYKAAKGRPARAY